MLKGNLRQKKYDLSQEQRMRSKKDEFAKIKTIKKNIIVLYKSVHDQQQNRKIHERFG